MQTIIRPLLVLLTAVAQFSLAQEYSPALSQTNPTNLYWGDLHVHSNRSPDAFAFGNATLSPEVAFRFARGEKVQASNGMDARLRQPLDFLLVADHAEFIGIFPKLVADAPDFIATDLGKQWQALYREKGDIGVIINEWLSRIQDPNYVQELSQSYRESVWRESAEIADTHNVPGVFTAFVGYEWTAMKAGNNLHRVVIYRDDASKATRFAPFSALDSKDPEELWSALDRYQRETGGEVMAIPHNGNVSNGLMFATETLSGGPLTQEYARQRAYWEPLYEVTQVKGDGETHPFLSPNDEFADFETWDDDNIARTVAKTNAMLKHEYARSALKLGLQLQSKLGANPFGFGMIGSTDDHTALATADDNNFWGKFLDSEPGAERGTNQMGGSLWENWKLAASGYTAVWARENTREALFDALRRKEVYATTGPRIALRFFGGWEFSASDANASDLALIGYDKGVPMGGMLHAKDAKKRAPTFLLHAVKDPHGANLDRLQIVKGWLNTQGEVEEKVYDVALSDGRSIDKLTGKAPAIESTVNVEAASYNNSLGEVSWNLVWKDPSFNPEQSAFYYVRVIEIPTPRWTAYDARFFNLKVPAQVPMVTQERVYSSPIWYQP